MSQASLLVRILSFSVSFFLIIPNATSAPRVRGHSQQTATISAVTLQSALAALSPNVAISDITLSGTVRRIAGSDDQSGTVVLQALSGGYSKIQLSLPSGSRIETRSVTSSTPSGSWSGPDGVAHPVAQHNLVIDCGLFPALTVAGISANPNSLVTLIGQETKNSQSVIHLSASQQFPTLSGDTAALMQRLSRVDIFLDPATSLPLFLDFNTHADDNALLDIPVEIQFSDYRQVSGIQVPFHIQKYLNNSLVLDLQMQNAAVNSGLSASLFSVQ